MYVWDATGKTLGRVDYAGKWHEAAEDENARFARPGVAIDTSVNWRRVTVKAADAGEDGQIDFEGGE
jgi:hypothetical protein